MTLNAGPRPVRGVRSSRYPLDGVDDDNRPILIQKGAWGRSRPTRDLAVSPQHRILVGGNGQLERLFSIEFLVRAKALTDQHRIRFMREKREITWVHFALDQHHVILANGLQCESLYLGPMVVNSLSADERAELKNIFGQVPFDGSAMNGGTARPFQSVRATRV